MTMKFAVLSGMSGMSGMNNGVIWHGPGMRIGQCKTVWRFMPACQHASKFLKHLSFGGGYTDYRTVYPPQKGSLMETLTAALKYTHRGLAAIPIHRDERKNPYLSTYTEFYMRLPTWEQWRKWANRWPLCNIGLITGYWQLCALDFDTEESYLVWSNGPGRGVKGQTWTTRTSRGYHVWFDVEGDPGESRSYTYQGHEVLLRAKGGYCIVPPSIHHSGARYRTVHKVEPWQTDSIEHYLRGWELKTKPAKLSDLSRLSFAASADPGRALSTSQNHTGYRLEELIPIPEGSKPNGRGAYKVRCPFHDDQTPSAWLNVDQQRFGCNACWPNLYWDTANVIAMLKGVTNEEAYRYLIGQ